MDTNNRIIRALSEPDRHEVLKRSQRVHLAGRTILDRAGEETAVVHFPETAVISTIATYSDGSSIEMANIGREACTGIGLILGHRRQLNTNEVQLSGDALEIPADVLSDLRTTLPGLESALFSAVQALFFQVMVSSACNGKHLARQRLARWLLTMRDRNDRETMRLTHEFLAEMLGVRRATVTEIIRDFQSEGLIETSRKEVRIVDAEGLGEVSCECYFIVRNAYESLLPQRKT